MRINIDDREATERVREALSRVAAVRGLDGRIVVDVPVMYPSGATAVVEVERNVDRYWVSDMGHGRIETEFVAAQDYFSAAARRAASDYGVEFDGNAIFALWVPSARLEAAIVCVANASNRACSDAIRVASEAKGRRENDRIFQRIQKVFGPEHVTRSLDVAGRHAHWEAHNVVVFSDRRRAVFEAMTSHPNSVSSRFLMFSDIKSADEEISLNAVVRDLSSLDEKAQIIGNVANIVGIDATDEELMRFAKAS